MKKIREIIHTKYDGHCAYCGKKITIKQMQIDHIVPLRSGGTNEIENLNPSCSRCNHYKRADSLKMFREMLRTLHERVLKIYICKVADDYNIINITPFDGVFYFEKLTQKNSEYTI